MNVEKYTQLLEDGELFSYINDLQQRIDKAIDYIEKHSNKTSEYLDVWEVKELLEILKGSNND